MPIKSCLRLGLFLIVTASFPVASTAEGASDTKFTVSWSGEQPATISVVDDVDTETKLSPGMNDFEGAYGFRPNTFLPIDLSLVAKFQDGESATLPIRARPALPVIRATIYRVHVKSCSLGEIGDINRRMGSVDRALKAYFVAVEAYNLTGADSCGPKMRGIIAKIWLDRSYELAQLKPYFRLDPEAVHANATYNPAYGNNLVVEDHGLALKFANDWKIEAISQRSFDLAAKINDQLIASYNYHSELAAAFQRQSITLSRLRADAASIPAATIASVPLPAPAATP